MARAPASAIGIEVKTPKAAAPSARNSWFGPSSAALKPLEAGPGHVARQTGRDPGETRLGGVAGGGTNHLPDQREAQHQGERGNEDRADDENENVLPAQNHTPDLPVHVEGQRVAVLEDLEAARAEAADRQERLQHLADPDAEQKKGDGR
jgi:hypothetical protein